MRNSTGNILFLATIAASAACSVSVTTGDGTTAGAGGGLSTGSTTAATSTASTGSTTGAGGSTSTGTTTGTGGAAGAGGTVADSGTDGATCLDPGTGAGDTPNPDLCSTISAYRNIMCPDGMGGQMLPDGLAFCNQMHDDARPGAFQVFFDCINAQSKVTTPCSTAASDVCTDKMHWPNSCQVGKVPVGDAGASWDCTDLSAKCAAVAKADCDTTMNVFTDAARSEIYSCFDIRFAQNGASMCQADFIDCVSDPAHMP
jgi:hypothetical protein